ncbi:MAG: carbamoyltransferase [Deltaproteobacteria bacterium]|nr:carbamoyltransferase [Deltaproteobacteria bacterium]
MKILGISAFYHDSAAALLVDGDIVAAAQEERFSRKKHDSSFPVNAARFCLEYGGVSIDELDAVAFYDKPFLKFERLLETYYAFAPRGFKSYLSAMPIWIKEKLMLKKLIKDEMSKIGPFNRKRTKLLFTDHHLAHAASAFFPSPYSESAIVTIDGVGEWATATIGKGKGHDIEILKEMKFPHSAGLLYSAFTYYLGFKVNSGEYKLMGLSPYGNPDSAQVRNFKNIITNHLIDMKEDGSIWMNQEYFDYATGIRMVKDEKWEKLFGFPCRKPESELEQRHADLALAIQQITEEIVFRMAKTAKTITAAKFLCLSGGVALNCVANGKLLGQNLFDGIWIQPAAGDAGGALGAAFAAHHMYYGNDKKIYGNTDQMKGSFLGPEYSDMEIKTMAESYKAPFCYYENFDDLCSSVADYLACGKVVGWFQGRMEWGPRALGNRSILGDARNKDMQKRLNVKIKFRESFRPFAPSVLNEDREDYFDIKTSSPYMLLIAQVNKKRRIPLPEDYHRMSIREKLYYLRSDIPAVTHLDYSARVQTVDPETNPRYAKLINAFKQKTGCGAIINTSFNVRGEPIVCTPEDAYKCFMRTDMDYLIVGNYVFDKKNQPGWKEEINWRQQYSLD